MEYIEQTREEAIESLADAEYERLDDEDVVNVLINGCPGWRSLACSDKDLKQYYEQYLHRKLIIVQDLSRFE